MRLSRPKWSKNGFRIYKDDMFGLYKLDIGWQYLKDNEGYFYLQSGDKEWIIYCDDVFATYDRLMEMQKRYLSENGIQVMMYEDEYRGKIQ